MTKLLLSAMLLLTLSAAAQDTTNNMPCTPLDVQNLHNIYSGTVPTDYMKGQSDGELDFITHRALACIADITGRHATLEQNSKAELVQVIEDYDIITAAVLAKALRLKEKTQ